MNIASLRTVLKAKWLTYYRDNRHWITRLRVWGTYEEKRRPSSSFILGALSAQEPELMELLPLVVDLNNNPDRIVTALGLDFNPEDEMDAFEQLSKAATPLPKQDLKPINLVRQAEPIREPIPQPVSQPNSRAISPPIDPPPSASNRQASNRLPTNPPTNRTVSPPASPSTSPSSSPSTSQSSYQPASQFTQPMAANSNARIPLDTAQLKIHEQPDRGAGNSTTPAVPTDRNRDAEP